MDDMQDRVLAAREDETALARLIEDNRVWILRCASQAAHRYISDSDDEWSVALMAFHEAVTGYDPEKGAFRSLAAVVIRRRVLDYLRAEGRRSAEIVVMPGAFDGELDPDEAGGTDLRVQRSISAASLAADGDDSASRAREEIAGMQEILALYGFSFFDLAACSPKAEKTKRSCAVAVRTLIASLALMARMRLKRMLPVKELSQASGVVRKILDRHRRYIIASAEILDGDFPILASYLDHIRKG